MFREIGARATERERVEPDRGSRGSGTVMTTDGPETARDALTHDLDLPRGSSREPVQAQGRAYRLSGHDVRTLAAAGAFRVVPAGELTPSHARTPTRASRSCFSSGPLLPSTTGSIHVSAEAQDTMNRLLKPFRLKLNLARIEEPRGRHMA